MRSSSVSSSRRAAIGSSSASSRAMCLSYRSTKACTSSAASVAAAPAGHLLRACGAARPNALPARGGRHSAQRSARAGTPRPSRPSTRAAPGRGRSLHPHGDAAPRCRNSASRRRRPPAPAGPPRARPDAAPAAAGSRIDCARAGDRPPASPAAPRSRRPGAEWPGKALTSWRSSCASAPRRGRFGRLALAAAMPPSAMATAGLWPCAAPAFGRGAARAALDHVGQRRAVQRLEVGLQGRIEQVLQAAARRQGADVGARIETLDQAEIGFGGPHHVADADRRRVLQTAAGRRRARAWSRAGPAAPGR